MVVEAAVAVPLERGGPGIDVLLQGRWQATPRWGVGGVLDIPLLAATVRSGVNSANVSAAFVGPELSATLLDMRGLRLTANGGVALAWLHAEGTAQPPYSSKSDRAIVALPLLGAEVAPRVLERVHLCLAGRLGVALPKPEIAFAGARVATWGRPLVLLSAGVGLDF